MDLRVFKTNLLPYHSNYVIIKLRGDFPPECNKTFFAQPPPPPPPEWGLYHIPAGDVVWILLGRNVFERRPLFYMAVKLSQSKSYYNAVILEVILSTKDRNTL
jgi:hypothetical protein